MDNTDLLLNEAESLIGSNEPGSEARLNQIISQLEKTDCPGQRERITALLHRRMDAAASLLDDVRTGVLRTQIDDKAYKLIPWSYIAKEYFGKSVSWLTQRVNGYQVRGKVYTLNAEQKATLNRALREIGDFIGSYQIS